MRTEIILGDRVKCRLTGFKGIAVARTDWIYGCVRWGVQSEKLAETGLTMEPQWFDEDQLTITRRTAAFAPEPEAAAAAPKPTTKSGTGGPDRGESADDPTETG